MALVTGDQVKTSMKFGEIIDGVVISSIVMNGELKYLVRCPQGDNFRYIIRSGRNLFVPYEGNDPNELSAQQFLDDRDPDLVQDS